MSDLISRSELYMNDLIRRKDVLALFPTNDCSDKMVGLYERVLDIPIAYSIENVIQEIDDDIAYIEADDTKEKFVHYESVASAIRKGGLEYE